MAGKNGTLNIEKAKVNGPEVTNASQDKTLLDELLAKIDLESSVDEAKYRIVNAELSREIVGEMRGHFAKNLIYNIPRRSERGQKSYKECDLMEGKCPYKGKTPHIHILGVGIQGALTAMRSYGRIHADVPEMPEIVEQGDRLYWAAYAVAIDRHTGNQYARWYFEPVQRKAGQKFIENEFGASIAQSKALRNVILALIPARLMESWLEDYRAGKIAFNVNTAKDMGYGPEPEKEKPKAKDKPKPKPKPNAQTPGGRDLAKVTADLAKKMEVDLDELDEWRESFFEQKGRATLILNKALNEEGTELQDVKEKFEAWKKKQAEATEDAEDGEQQEMELDDN